MATPWGIILPATSLGLVLVLAFKKSFSSYLRQHVLIPKLTILADIPQLGKPRKDGKLPGRAIICGGSIAGLLSAAVCADNYEEVLVIEPEAWLLTEEGTHPPSRPSTRLTTEGFVTSVNKRTRVPQYMAAHITQPVSVMALRELFPNFDEEAAALEGRPAPCNMHIYLSGELMKSPHHRKDFKGPPVETTYLMRQGYESLLRRLVRKYRPNVSFLTGTVTRLEFAEDDTNMVTGVHVRTQNDADHIEHGSLVVDATGHTQAGFHKWLKGRGLPPSLRVQYNSNVFYMTSTYYIPEELKPKVPIPGGFSEPRWLYTGFPNTKIENKGLLMGIAGNSQLVVACGGWNIIDRPHDPLAIKAYIESMKLREPTSPWVLELMDFLHEHADELSATYDDIKVPPCSYINYPKAPPGSIPANFVAVGDSVTNVNPIYAQGMSKACIGAVTLDGLLRREVQNARPFPQDFSTMYFKAHAPRIHGIWDLPKTVDYGFKSTTPVEGETLDQGNFMRTFGRNAIAVALKDPQISDAFWNVRMLIAPPTDIFTLRTMWKVGWHWLTN